MLRTFFITIYLLCTILLFAQTKESTFKLCDSIQTYPYYYPELKYEGGFWEIKQHFIKNFPKDEFQLLSKNTGIITVQFKVNCNGETGDFVIKQCDLDYQSTVLHKDISEYFLRKTMTLHNWIPAKNKEGIIVNSHKFFSFRIKEGLLLEILPK